MGNPTRVTVYLDEDEFWPWTHFTSRRWGEPIEVDRETAERWEQGIRAAKALQQEMGAALESARKERIPNPFKD